MGKYDRPRCRDNKKEHDVDPSNTRTAARKIGSNVAKSITISFLDAEMKMTRKRCVFRSRGAVHLAITVVIHDKSRDILDLLNVVQKSEI